MKRHLRKPFEISIKLFALVCMFLGCMIGAEPSVGDLMFSFAMVAGAFASLYVICEFGR